MKMNISKYRSLVLLFDIKFVSGCFQPKRNKNKRIKKRLNNKEKGVV